MPDLPFSVDIAHDSMGASFLLSSQDQLFPRHAVCYLRIIQGEAKQLREATGKKIYLDSSTSQKLANRMDIDLRKTTRIVKDAFTRAMRAEEKIAKLIIPSDGGPQGRKSAYSRSEIGFY